MKKVLIATGGTGGHLYPALALGGKLREREVDVVFVGSKFRMEKDIITENKFRFIGIPIKPFSEFTAGLRLMESIIKTLKIIKNENPDAIIGFGNYISLPVIIAGIFYKKKIYLHEQNVKMGIVNTLFYRMADKVFLGYDTTFEKVPQKYQHKLRITGNPVREIFYKLDTKKEREKLKFDKNEKMVFILGGNSNSKNINEAVKKKWDKFFLEKEIRLYWATGKSSFNEINENITKIKNNDIVKPYFDNIAPIIVASSLVLASAGATLISELIAVEKPSVLIPFGDLSSGQFENAQMLGAIGACEIFSDEETDEALERVFELLKDEKKLKEMSEKLRKLKKADSIMKIVEELDIWRN